MKVVILAAGIGSRLGKPHPKPLTMLDNGRTIIQHQIRALRRYLNINDIYAVIGFKKELIMEAVPELGFIYNDYFDTTNTAKSLWRALRRMPNEEVLWLNGDVVLDHRVIQRVLASEGSCMAVNSAAVGDEEVKYQLDDNGLIHRVSKDIPRAEAAGEALGVNRLARQDVPTVIEMLDRCDDQAYFERGLEFATAAGVELHPVDVSGLMCREIDFAGDLQEANAELKAQA